MESTSPEKLWGAKRKRVIEELVKGRGIATQLQNLLLLQNPSELDHGSVSAEELVGKIFSTFTETLSVLNSSDQIQGNIIADVGSNSTDHLNSQDSGESVKRSQVEDRRGRYKRRKTLDSWMTVASTLEDGYKWRKYGQKGILNSKYPRCYFRCTHKNDQGCQALKQIQQFEDSTKMFNITYFGHHTCSRAKTIMKAAQMVSDSYSVLGSCSSHSFEPNTVPFIRRESKEETTSDQQSNDHILDSSISWQEDVIALESSNKPPIFLSPEMGSDDHEYHLDSSTGYVCASSSSYGLDMDTSLIRCVDFDNDFHELMRCVDFDNDFHIDEIEFFGAPT